MIIPLRKFNDTCIIFFQLLDKIFLLINCSLFRYKMKLSILILVVLICQVYADSNKDREFINIQNPIPCVRRFNTTHQIGCADKDIGRIKANEQL